MNQILNTLFPGLPDYTGPKNGLFTLLHHEGPLAEWSSNIQGRIDYINKHKPKSEIDIRLRHIVYIPKGAIPELNKARSELDKARSELDKAYLEYDKACSKYEKACSEWDKARSEYDKARSEWDKACSKFDKASLKFILPYLRKHVPDCRWNGRELEFD